uniref:Uncharacterized protein n=1 Tax=Arundo donax TaxID=35708 RepID=A0A0A8ZKY5_ARUDO
MAGTELHQIKSCFSPLS